MGLFVSSRLLERFDADLATARADAIRLIGRLVERGLLVDGTEGIAR